MGSISTYINPAVYGETRGLVWVDSFTANGAGGYTANGKVAVVPRPGVPGTPVRVRDALTSAELAPTALDENGYLPDYDCGTAVAVLLSTDDWATQIGPFLTDSSTLDAVQAGANAASALELATQALAQSQSGNTSWDTLVGKPTTFPPSTHTHTAAQISDAGAVGQAVMKAADKPAARAAIDAAPSSTVSFPGFGTTATTAATGNHAHAASAIAFAPTAQNPATNVQQAVANLGSGGGSGSGVVRVNVVARGADPLGVTDATTIARTAITDAKAQGLGIDWGEGDFKITANLPGFWDVEHFGSGRLLLPGGVVFKFDPDFTDVNQIFTAGTGVSSTNDGLSASTPVSLSRSQDILRWMHTGPRVNAQIRVNLKGTYTGGWSYSVLPKTIKPIQFWGEPLAAGEPVTTINWNSNPAQQFGLRFDPAFTQVEVRNLIFNGFAVDFNGYGLLIKSGGHLWAYDCRANNSDCGFANINGAVAYFQGCEATGCTTGFRAQYGATVTWNTCVATACDINFNITRNAVGHLDFSTTQDANTYGVLVEMAARLNILGSKIWRNPVGVSAQGAGEWVNADADMGDADPNDFGVGTANANTVPWEHHGVARENRQYSQTSENEFRLGASTDILQLTGSTTDTVMLSGSVYGRIPKYALLGEGKKLRFRIVGSTVGAGTQTISVRTTSSTGTNNVVIASVTIPNGQTGPFVWEIEMASRPGASQFRVWHRLQMNGQPAVVAINGIITVDATLQRWFRYQGQLSDATATLQLHSVECFMVG